MNRQQKFERSTRLNFTEEQLRQAKANFDYGAKRFPEEHAKVVQMMQSHGLGGHREITEYYLTHKMPMSEQALATISIYADSTYAGPHGRGEAHGAPTTSGGTKEDLIFRPTIQPGEVK